MEGLEGVRGVGVGGVCGVGFGAEVVLDRAQDLMMGPVPRNLCMRPTSRTESLSHLGATVNHVKLTLKIN